MGLLSLPDRSRMPDCLPLIWGMKVGHGALWDTVARRVKRTSLDERGSRSAHMGDLDAEPGSPRRGLVGFSCLQGDAALGFGCYRKKRIISRLASGPRGSV